MKFLPTLFLIILIATACQDQSENCAAGHIENIYHAEQTRYIPDIVDPSVLIPLYTTDYYSEEFICDKPVD